MKNETPARELTPDELDAVSGGFIKIYYSEGARAFGVIVGGYEVYVGANSAGYNTPNGSGQIRY
jgi:hypothetical protein